MRDPRGAETTFTYLGSGNGNDRWKLASRTDRLNTKTSYAYDTLNRTTTATAVLGRITKFTYDAEGKLTKHVNPKSETTSVEWTAGRHVRKVTEPGGAFSIYDYDDNGYLISETDQVNAKTVLTYENPAVDANDVAGKWKAGRTKGHISQLDTKTEPKGTASPAAGDYMWNFDYDAKGNPTRVTDPEEGVTQSFYLPDGTLDYQLDQENRKTDFNAYDPNGFPTEIVDAANQRTRFNYDADGNLLWTQDPEHDGATGTDVQSYRNYLYYDSFHRMGRQSAPRSTRHDRGNLIWSAAEFDANDNTVATYAPAYGRQYTRGAKTSTTYDAMDQPRSETEPDTTVGPDGTAANPGGEKSTFDYDAAGRMTKMTSPRGNQSSTADDFAVLLDYDALDRVTKQRRLEFTNGAVSRTQATQFCYDGRGDLARMVKPNAGAGTVDCAAAAGPFTTSYTYDAAHQLLSETDPENRKRSQTYDAHGNIETVTDERGKLERRHYDERDLLIKLEQPFDTGRPVTTRYFYDKAGNQKRVVSPRGWDASADKVTFTDYVTEFTYDAVDRVTKIALPKQGSETPTFVHSTYDKNGNRTMTSLPTTATSAAAVAPEHKTTNDYWDPGWIRTSNEPADPKVRFDYTAEGWQASRTPENGQGEEDLLRRLTWEYWADGMLKAKKDRGRQLTRYFYDANDNLTVTDDAGGVTSDKEAPIDIRATFDDFDQPSKVRTQKVGKTSNWNTTLLSYDLDGNVVSRTDDRVEDGAGAVVQAGRKSTFTYDGSDWLKTTDDAGKDAASATDDRRIVTQYFPTGEEQSRTISRNGSTRQTTTWDYFDNGKLRKLETKNGSGVVKESHDVTYLQGAVYVNGHRVTDTFKRDSPNAAAPCRTGTCTTTFTYDGRDRLKEEKTDRGTGGIKTNTYELDAAGNLVREDKHDKPAVRYRYTGTQLDEQLSDAGTVQFRYHHRNGDLRCITTPSGTAEQCGSGVAAVVADYNYDDFHRLLSTTKYDGAGGKTDTSSYVYDALDRTVEQTETHRAKPDRNRTTTSSYLGLSNQVTEEKLVYDAATSNRPTRTKSYAYDTAGHRIAMSDQKGGDAAGAKEYTFGTDVHGSVSMLLDDTGAAKASYGYDAYGGREQDLTRETDPDSATGEGTDETDPLNPFRYSGKRLDTGSGTLDMGARRFSPDTARFLQADVLDDAMDDLDLASDPLTGNRYSLAGGNPVSFVELDGHMLAMDGGGGGSTSSDSDAGSSSSGGSGTSGRSSGGSTATRTTASTNVFTKPFSEIGDPTWQRAESNAAREEAKWNYEHEPDPNQPGWDKFLNGEVDRSGRLTMWTGSRWVNYQQNGIPVGPLVRAVAGGVSKVSRTAIKAGAARASQNATKYRSFTRSNFRENLARHTGRAPANADAHHVFPQKFAGHFKARGINIHDPRYGAWWKAGPHRSAARNYNREWQLFFQQKWPRVSQKEVVDFGRQLSNRYGQSVGF